MTTLSTLSTLQKALSNRENIARMDKAVQKAQQELTTGLRQDVFADTGFRAAQSLDMRNRMDRIEAFSVSNQLLAGKISVMNDQVSSIRASVQEFMAGALSLAGGGAGAAVVALDAQALIAELTTQLNTAYGGDYQFSGMDTGAVPLGDTSVLGGLVQLPAGATSEQVAAERARLDAWFGLGADAPETSEFTRQVYSGSTSGVQSAQINEHSRLNYGFRADDESLRNIFKGLAMFASAAYDAVAEAGDRQEWLTTAMNNLASGVTGLQDHEASLGNQRSLLEQTSARQYDLKAIYNNRVVEIEGVDGYEAATRLEQLSAQLEASYHVTVRMQSLSLLNYL